MTEVTRASEAVSMIAFLFGVLFIVIGVLSYTIYPGARLGVFTVSTNQTPEVRAALIGAHNLAHDTLFIISAAIGIMAMITLWSTFRGKGLALGASFLILSVILLLIEPAGPIRPAVGAAYPTVHLVVHDNVGILQVIVGALCFPLLRRRKF